MTLIIKTHWIECRYIAGRYVECCDLFTVMMNVTMLIVCTLIVVAPLINRSKSPSSVPGRFFQTSILVVGKAENYPRWHSLNGAPLRWAQAVFSSITPGRKDNLLTNTLTYLAVS
jgi:hypothetical protein